MTAEVATLAVIGKAPVLASVAEVATSATGGGRR
jgi:hypothetical protein